MKIAVFSLCFYSWVCFNNLDTFFLCVLYDFVELSLGYSFSPIIFLYNEASYG